MWHYPLRCPGLDAFVSVCVCVIFCFALLSRRADCGVGIGCLVLGDGLPYCAGCVCSVVVARQGFDALMSALLLWSVCSILR